MAKKAVNKLAKTIWERYLAVHGERVMYETKRKKIREAIRMATFDVENLIDELIRRLDLQRNAKQERKRQAKLMQLLIIAKNSVYQTVEIIMDRWLSLRRKTKITEHCE